MVFAKTTVTNEIGIYARTASNLACLCMNCDSKIELRVGQNTLNPANIFDLMTRPIKYGTEIEFSCDGHTEEEDLERILSFFQAGMIPA